MTEKQFDIVIAGAGLAGSLLARRMGKRGWSVKLLDKHEHMRPVFRAEKIEAAQAESLRRLDALELRRPVAPATGMIMRFQGGRGKVADTKEQYGIRYHDTVNAIRDAAAQYSDFEVATVTSISSGKEGAGPEVTLATGEKIRGTVCVVACGYRTVLHKQLGVAIDQDRQMKSLFVGFDVKLKDPRRLEYRGCNEHLEQGAGGIDYLTFFRIGDTLRANFSAQFGDGDPRFKQLLRAPEETLRAWFPNLAGYLGEFEVASKMEPFVTRYYKITPPQLPGVVVIGDSFQSASPATGTGMSKLLMEVELLCEEFLPAWLQKGRVDLDDLQAFYRHQDKTFTDDRSLDLWRMFMLSRRLRRWVGWGRKLRHYCNYRTYSLSKIRGKINGLLKHAG